MGIAKITDQQLRTEWQLGLTVSQIASKYGMSKQAVNYRAKKLSLTGNGKVRRRNTRVKFAAPTSSTKVPCGSCGGYGYVEIPVEEDSNKYLETLTARRDVEGRVLTILESEDKWWLVADVVRAARTAKTSHDANYFRAALKELARDGLVVSTRRRVTIERKSGPSQPVVMLFKHAKFAKGRKLVRRKIDAA